MHPGVKDGPAKDGHDGRALEQLITGTRDNTRLTMDRRSRAKDRGLGAGKDQAWTGRSRLWKGMDGDLEESGSDVETKRRWEKSGLAWMKKSGDEPAWSEDGKPEEGDGKGSKRRWKNSP